MLSDDEDTIEVEDVVEAQPEAEAEDPSSSSSMAVLLDMDMVRFIFFISFQWGPVTLHPSVYCVMLCCVVLCCAVLFSIVYELRVPYIVYLLRIEFIGIGLW